MIKKIFPVSVLILLLALQASAQPEYDRARRQIEIDQANQRARDKQNAYNNRPSDTKWGAATGVLVRPSKNIVDDVEGRERQRKFLEQQKREQDAKVEEILKKSAADDIKDGGRSVAYRSYYDQLGYFTQEEVYRLGNLTKKKEDDVNPYAYYYLSFGDKYKEYLKIADNGSFDEVMLALEPFAILPRTAMKGLKKLQSKFPEKQFEIDMASLELLKNYYNDVHGLGNVRVDDYGNFGTYDIPEYFEWSDLFVELGKKYPDIVAKGMANDDYNTTGYFDPYTRTIQKLSSSYRTTYKKRGQAAKKTKEVEDAREAIRPKILAYRNEKSNKK